MDDKKEILTPSPEYEAVSETEATEQPEVKFETEGSTIFVKHEYNTKKPVKNGWAKRIMYCVVALLICGAIALSSFLVVKLIPKEEDIPEQLSSIETQSIEVLKYDTYVKETTVKADGAELLTSTNISGVGIFNQYEEYSIMPYTEEVSTGENETAECIKWYILGLKPEVTLTDELHDHLRNCMNIYATAAMENTYDTVEEYHQAYGIDYEKPTRAFYIKFTDDKSIEVLVGRQTASRDANYLTVKGIGDDTVYIVPATYIVNYDYLPKDFADLQMLSPIEHTKDNDKYFTINNLSRFDYIKLSGSAVGDREIKFEMSTSVSADYMPYMMVSPYKRPADEAFLENILAFASGGLSADDLYSFKATDENREMCGFNDPSCVIEAKIGDFKFKLIIGGLVSEDDTGLSVMIEGKEQIFSINAETFDFLSPDITKMFNSDLIIEDIYTVEGVTFETEAGKYSYELTHTPRDGSDSVFDTTVRHKGEKVDTDSFKALYQRVILLSLLSFTTEAEKGDVVLTVTFDYIEDFPKRIVEFSVIEDDPYHYIAWVDGVPLGEVLKTSLTDITTNLANYVTGGVVPTP